MNKDSRLVIGLSDEELEQLSRRAQLRQTGLNDFVVQTLQFIAGGEWTPLMARTLDRAIATAPSRQSPMIALRPGCEDGVDTVLRSDDPLDQAQRSARALLVRFDAESCFLEAGAWLLSALYAYIAFEPGYARARSLVSAYGEIAFEGGPTLLDRLRSSQAGGGFVADRIQMLLRKRSHEQGYIRQHVRSTLESSLQRADHPKQAGSTTCIAITLPRELYQAIGRLAAERGVTPSMMGRAAVARLLHMRPHLVLVKDERTEGT